MLTYPWKCTVLHCNHLGNTWKPLVLMIRHFDYCPNASEGDNQSVRSSAPVVSKCFPGGYNVKLYISRGRLAWWLLTFLDSATTHKNIEYCNRPKQITDKNCCMWRFCEVFNHEAAMRQEYLQPHPFCFLAWNRWRVNALTCTHFYLSSHKW